MDTETPLKTRPCGYCGSLMAIATSDRTTLLCLHCDQPCYNGYTHCALCHKVAVNNDR